MYQSVGQIHHKRGPYMSWLSVIGEVIGFEGHILNKFAW